MPGKTAGSRLAGTRGSKGVGTFVLRVLFLKHRNGIRLKFVPPLIPPKKTNCTNVYPVAGSGLRHMVFSASSAQVPSPGPGTGGGREALRPSLGTALPAPPRAGRGLQPSHLTSRHRLGLLSYQLFSQLSSDPEVRKTTMSFCIRPSLSSGPGSVPFLWSGRVK